MEVARMQVAPVRNPLPRYVAAATQVHDHSADAYKFTRAAVGENNSSKRFDLALRAYNSFDHAIMASKQLPLGYVANVADLYKGYENARNIVTGIVATGVLGGVNLRVGKQELLAGREEFLRGVKAVSNKPRVADRYRALDWVSASLTDAATGAVMTRKFKDGAMLVAELSSARRDIIKGASFTNDKVDKINKLFESSITTYDQLIADAEAASKAA
jgi:hypothetical protein